MPHCGQHVGHPVAQPQGPPAQGPEVGSAPQDHPGQQVKTHLSPARHGGVDEQGHRHYQPEQQVQHAPDEGQGDAHPHDPQQVVHQADGRPQHQSAPQKDGLLGNRNLHLSGRAGQKSRPTVCPGRPHR